MKDYQKITFQEMSSVMTEVSSDQGTDFIHRKAEDEAFGSFENRMLKNRFFGIHEYKADLTGKFRISFDEAHMLHNMNMCMAMDGRISLDLKESSFVTTLTSHEHHSIYSHETAYDLLIDQAIHVLHITVDREYYASLLHESERSAAVMKEKLLKKDMVWSGTGDVSTSMKRAMHDLLYNPLSGNLKSIFIEAKILELVALQLDDFNQDNTIHSVKAKDNDVFYDIRNYLDEHFREDLSLRLISRMFGVNEFKLKKGFKSEFKTTIFDYIHDLKMLHARTLLLDERMFVNEVAGVIGYKNANHFSTAFKRKFGVSPTAMK